MIVEMVKKEGKTIDMNRINLGEGVLFVAKKYLTVWPVNYPDESAASEKQFFSHRYAHDLTRNEEEVNYLNDVFLPGNSLRLMQLYTKEEEPFESTPENWVETNIENLFTKVDQQVEILEVIENGYWWPDEANIIITTEEGFKQLGFANRGYKELMIHLSAEPDRGTENLLMEKINIIAHSAGNNIQISNDFQTQRENHLMNWLIGLGSVVVVLMLLFIVVIMINFSIYQGMLEEKRTLGTLRALGANPKTLLLIYMKEILYTLVPGAVIGFLLSGGFLWVLWQNNWHQFIIGFNKITTRKLFCLWMPLTYTAYFAIVAYACIRSSKKYLSMILGDSVVENIREL